MTAGEGPAGVAPPPSAVPGLGPRLYVAWAALSIGASLALAGPAAESLTRLLVLLFLLVQLLFRERLALLLPRLRPAVRFVLLGTGLAAAVEGFHMVSTPVFVSLRVAAETPVPEALRRYGLDLLLTVPAYLVVFSVIWAFVARWEWPPWRYVLVAGLAQTLGDGGLFFFGGAPAMLAFLPYPMSNYHAVNVLPFLAVRGDLPPGRGFSPKAYLLLPAVVASYLACGAAIRVVGRALGLGAA